MGACAAPSLPPPPLEDQPPPASEAATPEAATPEAEEETVPALPTDEAAATPDAREPSPDEDGAAPATEAMQAAATVGLLLPLSGRYAAEGETLLHAAQLALFDTADEQFVLLPRDTGGHGEGRGESRARRCSKTASISSWVRCSPRG